MRYCSLWLIAVLVSGCGQSAASPTCTIAVTTTRAEADPVVVPPVVGYPGKRATNTGGMPNVPVNKYQGGC